MDNAPVIRVFWKDLDCNYLGCNIAFANDAGLQSVDEIIGKNDFELAWKAHGKLYRADDRKVMKSNTEKLNFEESIFLPNGEVIVLRTSKVPLRDNNGKVIGVLGIYEDITASKLHQQQLQHIAYHDILTGLPNRLLLADRMEVALAHSRRDNSLVVVCYLDLDGFKAVNDNFGHKVGDCLLLEAANRMKHSLREDDTVARLGGDEFAFLLLGLTTIEECEAAVSRFLIALNSPFHIENHTVSISASIGATIYPNDNADADTLLRHADQSMYEAKQNQKNCFKIYNTTIAHEFRAKQDRLKEIETALFENEFVLFFQPKVDMQKGEIIGAEALIRWHHPERGLLMPNDFLGLIEHHPLAIQLDAWVMNHALKQMTKWHQCGLIWTISVNLSAGSLQTPNFSAQLAILLARYPNVKPQHFELEILETEALQDLTQTSEMMIACQKLGVKFSLDDFGTGYSSLAYLKHLPANILKIDQSFVRNMLDDSDDLAIVEGVIGLASSFKRQVIAEGVETIEHGTSLSQLKCRYAQGYAIAKPMPPVTFEIWAKTWEPPEEWQKQD
jgi:diguanylate cyclase (GGDEF)-like protein/PAS domain S-box-containing protein